MAQLDHPRRAVSDAGKLQAFEEVFALGEILSPHAAGGDAHELESLRNGLCLSSQLGHARWFGFDAGEERVAAVDECDGWAGFLSLGHHPGRLGHSAAHVFAASAGAQISPDIGRENQRDCGGFGRGRFGAAGEHHKRG